MFLFACTLCFGACGPKTRVAESDWSNGQHRVRESYYSDPQLGRVRHGMTTYWARNGELIATGRWDHGKPVDGICWIPAAGDAGSLGGAGHLERFKDGKSLGEIPGDIWR
jgi:hypothetical protein